MKAEAWVLRALGEFPATRRVLEALAEHHGAPCGKTLVDELIERGKVVMLGTRKAARYALPGYRLQRR